MTDSSSELHLTKTNDRLYWILAVIFGFASGYAHIRSHDLSLLMVTAFTMFLSYRRPVWPWRWMLAVALPVPLVELVSYLWHEHPTRASVIGSFLGLLPAFIAAYGGATLRRGVEVLFPSRKN